MHVKTRCQNLLNSAIRFMRKKITVALNFKAQSLFWFLVQLYSPHSDTRLVISNVFRVLVLSSLQKSQC